jgi:hypothetical protein
MLKQVGKQMRRPERVVLAVGDGGVAGGATAGVASAVGLNVVFPRSVPFSMWAGLTVSVDMVAGLPLMRSCSVFSLRDRTW